MDNLARALRSFQSGALTEDALFAEIDRLLQDGRSGIDWLKTLDKENTETPLPPDIHRAVLAKIQRVAPAESASPQSPEFSDPDASYTQLATSVFFDSCAQAAPHTELQARDNSQGNSQGNSQPNYSEPSLPRISDDDVKTTGDVLNDRFVLEERIGTGGMSSVYKALDRRKLEANDRNPYVAVKVLKVEFRARPDSLIALQREAKKSQSLAHPNIVRVYDFDRDGTTVYMTMEYLPGEPLAKRLRAPKFTGMEQAEAMRILEAMGSALQFAHENRIVHADFKPGNVILTPNGQVKVIDFGIARAFQRPDETDQEVTRFDPGSLGALTPTYASPEMLEHLEPDPRDDIYALACITYEMLTGRHPFGRMQATEARDGGLQLERRTGLTRRQFKALKSALAFDRAKRTSSVRQFLSEMRPEAQVAVSFSLPKLTRALVALLVVGIALYAATHLDVWRRTPLPQVSDTTTTAPPSIDIERPPPNSNEAPLPDSKERVSTSVPAESAIQTPAVSESVSYTPKSVAAPTVLSAAAVTDIVQRIPCSTIASSIKDSDVSLQGYLSAQYSPKQLEQMIKSLPGVGRVTVDVATVNANQCAVIDTYGPFWMANRAETPRAHIAARGGGSLKEGQPLIVEIGTPGYQSYVNVDYYALDGNVVHMLPSARAANNQAPANYTATLGDLGEWHIAPPFGREMVVLLVTSRPLFGAPRAEYESTADYLAAIKKQLDRLVKEGGNSKVVAEFVMIDTHDNKK